MCKQQVVEPPEPEPPLDSFAPTVSRSTLDLQLLQANPLCLDIYTHAGIMQLQLIAWPPLLSEVRVPSTIFPELEPVLEAGGDKAAEAGDKALVPDVPPDTEPESDES